MAPQFRSPHNPRSKLPGRGPRPLVPKPRGFVGPIVYQLSLNVATSATAFSSDFSPDFGSGAGGSNQAASVAKQVTAARGTTDSQVAARRAFIVSAIRGAFDGQSTSRVLVASISRPAVDSAVARLSAAGVHARVITAVESLPSLLVKAVGWIRSALNAEAAALAEAKISGSQSFAKALSALDAQVSSLQRGILALRFSASSQNASLQRAIGIIRSSAGSQSGAVIRAVSYLRSFAATNGQTAVRRLLVSIIRGCVNSEATVLSVMRALLRPLSAVNPESATLIRVIAAIRSAAGAEVANLQRITGIVRSATEGQATARQMTVSIVRGVTQAQIAARSAAIALVRIASNGQSLTRVLMVLIRPSATDAQQVAPAVPAGLHARLLGVVVTQAGGLQKLGAILRGAISAQSATRQVLASIARVTTDSQVAAVRRAGALVRSAAEAQATARTLLVSIARSVVDPEAMSSAASVVRSKILAAANAQVAFLVTAFNHAGINTGQPLAALQAQAVRVVKTIGWIRSALDAQANAIGRLVSSFRTLSATSIQSPALLRLTNAVRSAVDVQAATRRVMVSAIRSAVSAESTARTSALSVVRSAVNTQVGALKRANSVARSLVGTQTVLLARTISIARSAISTQVAALVPAHLGFTNFLSLSAVDAQVAAIRRSVAVLRAVLSGQAFNVVRLVSIIRTTADSEVTARTLAVFKRLATISGEATASSALRAFLKACSAASTEVAALVRAGLHTPAALAVAAANSARAVKLVSALRSASNAMAAFRGAFSIGLHLPADPLEAIGLAAVINRGKALVVQQAEAVLAFASLHHFGNFAAVVSAASAGAAALAKTVSKAFVVAAPSKTRFVLWFFRFVPLALRGRAVRLPEAQQFVSLPPAARHVVLPEAQLMVMLPPAVRRVVVPIEGDDMSDYEIRFPEPAFFSPLDPTDTDLFTFDWSIRGYPGDTIVFASIISVPSGVNFIGPAFISGQSVTITVGPFATVPPLPMTYSLRCMAMFASGRISNYSVPFEVMTL